MDIDILEVTEKDLLEVSKLISLVFNKPFRANNVEKLRWMLFSNPDADENIPKGWILKDQNVVVGFLANVIRRMSFFGQDFLVAYTSNYVVDQSHRFHGLKLAEVFMNQDKINFLLCSSGSDNSIKILKRFGAHQIMEADRAAVFIFNSASVMSYYLKKKNYTNELLNALLRKGFGFGNWFKRSFQRKLVWDDTITIKKVMRFNDKVNQLYEKNRLYNKVTSYRDSKRLNWLFVDGPIERSNTLIFNAYKENNLCGYAVTQDRNINGSNLKYRNVRDIFYERDNPLVFDVLVKKLLKESLEDGMDCLEFYNIPNDLISRLISAGAWRRNLSENPFLIYSRNKAYSNLANQASKWYLVPSDGDGGGWS